MTADFLDGKTDSPFLQCRYKLCKYLWRANSSQFLPAEIPVIKDEDDKSSLFGKMIQTISGPFSNEKRLRNQWENLYLPDSGGTLLDLGNGDPRWLAKAKRRGWTPKYQKEFPTDGLSGNSYNAITLRWILEYHPQPQEVVRQAYQLLAPGGRMVILLNNVTALGMECYRENWLPLTLPYVRRIFSLNAFRKFLKQCGIREYFTFLTTSVGHHPASGKTAKSTGSQENKPELPECEKTDFLQGENLVIVFDKFENKQ